MEKHYMKLCYWTIELGIWIKSMIFSWLECLTKQAANSGTIMMFLSIFFLEIETVEILPIQGSVFLGLIIHLVHK